MPRRAGVGVLTTLMVLVGCSGDVARSEPASSSTVAVPSTAAASASGPTASSGGPSSTVAVPSTAAASASGPATSPGDPSEGDVTEGEIAGDVGDPYHPELGNVGIDALHYDLDLVYDPSTGVVDGVARLAAVAEVDLAGFDLDLVGLAVSEVTVDGRPVEFAQRSDEVEIVLPSARAAGTDLVVEVAYGGELGAAAAESKQHELGWIVETWGSYVAAEPDGARRWFPADDHPSDKATFSVSVTVPTGYDVVAAGRLTARTELEGATVRWSFDAEEPMATYLMSVAVGDFEMLEEDGPDGVLIRHAVPPGFGTNEQLALTGEMIEVVAALFGPFPLQTYGVLVVPEELGFALENQTLTLIGTDFMASPERAEVVLVHEVAHQWAGNAVSPERWSDIWLNEGFATYAEWWWTEQRGGHSAAHQAAAARIAAGLGELRAPLDPGAAEMFSAAVYVRGALVLDALRTGVGDEVFVEVLHEWFARHGGGSASTDDFLALVTEMAGADAASSLVPWLTADDVPASDGGGEGAPAGAGPVVDSGG